MNRMLEDGRLFSKVDSALAVALLTCDSRGSNRRRPLESLRDATKNGSS